MNTTFTLMQAAMILGMPMAHLQRLVKQRKLLATKREADRVLLVEAAELQAFIARSK